MDKQVNIKILGNVQITDETRQPIKGFRSVKALALLGYLCVLDQPVSRPYLVNLFWPDMEESRGRRNLSWVLSQLTKFIPNCIEANRHTVHFVLQSHIDVDVHAFRELTVESSAERLAEAVSLYQDDLMSGIYLDDCPEFETWLIGEREIWRQRTQQAYAKLIRTCAEQGEYERGIGFAQRLLSLDPWNEDTHQQLMRLLAYSGQASAAASQYNVLTKVLEDELGVSPSAETDKLLAQIQDGTLPVPAIGKTQEVAARPKVNLPALTSLFVGREDEVQSITAEILDLTNRLVVLFGPGGIGKTWLAKQATRLIAADEAHPFTDGIYYVPLETIRTEEELIQQIGDRLDWSPKDVQKPILQQLKDFLQQRHLLLFLDNFEHLIEYTPLLTGLLEASQGLQILVTSRRRINIPYSWSLTLGGLAIPEEGEAITSENAADYPAIQLFLHRARQSSYEMVLSESDLEAIANICRFLSGWPLGIELASAWMRMMSPADIYDELQQNLDMLMEENQNAEPRHRNLNSVVAYSWQLLSDNDQQAMRRLAVFSDGFTRDAARQVTQTSLKTLARLIDHSMIQSDVQPGRFDFHPVMRRFMMDKLLADQTEAAEVRQAHAAYFQGFLSQQTAALQGSGQLRALQEMTPESANIRTAWLWAIEQAGSEAAVAFFLASQPAFFHFYDMRSRFVEGADLFQQAVESIGQPEPHTPYWRARYLMLARSGWFSFLLGEYETGGQKLSAAWEALDQAENRRDSLFARNYFSAVLRYRGRLDEARALSEETLQIARETGHRYAEAIASNILSQTLADQGDYAASERHGQNSLAIEQTIGNRWSMGFSFVNLGDVALATGDTDTAERHFNESLVIRREFRDLRGTAVCLGRLGLCAETAGNGAQAQAFYNESLAIFAEVGDRWGEATAHHQLGNVNASLANEAEAKHHFLQGLLIAREIDSAAKVDSILAATGILLGLETPPAMSEAIALLSV